jgi:dipeptidyl aminopeptidase/acylaminoacyl peptidase
MAIVENQNQTAAEEAGRRFCLSGLRPQSLPATAPFLSLEEILAIRHPEAPRWSRDGKWLAWRSDDGGIVHLWAAPVAIGEPLQISQGQTSAGGFDWGSDGRLAYAQGGNLWIARPDESPRPLTSGGAGADEPRWSPVGAKLAFSLSGVPHFFDFAAMSLTVLRVPGRMIPASGDGVGLRWSPDGSLIAISILDGSQRDLVVLDLAGRLIWRTSSADNENAFAWVDAGRLHYTSVDPACRRRVHRIADMNTGSERELIVEESAKGLKWELTPVVRPGGKSVLYFLTPENWPQVHCLNLDTGELIRLADGPGDDTAFQGDFLSCSPDGRFAVFSSNRRIAPNQRRLWLADIESQTWRPLTEGPGTDSCASFSPDGKSIAYLHCGPYESADIWVIPFEGGPACQISRSMPAPLGPKTITVPIHLTYPSRDGTSVHADLFLPKGFDSKKHYPAIVFLHGGMSRQMCFGWSPMKPYAVFYSFHQYLLHRGFVVLSVDYRGSCGYGRAYEEASFMGLCVTDLEDVIAGADFLKGLGFVDSQAIGVYGLSYGGYLTLGALTKYPETFSVGINVAGVYDWAQWAGWRERQWAGAPWYGAYTRLGGPPDTENAQVWLQASPRNFIDQLRRPLLNLMGTADERVDYQQLEQIVSDCVRRGKDFAALSYPGETHMFRHRHTWMDAFARIEEAFERYLKQPPAKRPPAMI